MNSNQGDTRTGQIPLNCGEDLTGKEGHLVKLADGGNIAEALLPTAITDITPFVCVSSGTLDTLGQFQPFTGEKNHQVRTKGTGSAGDQLVLADTGTAADKGKLRKLPATTGTYRVLAIAEADFVDGQLLKVRPIPFLSVTVA
jgi:hypothetical protein